MTTAAAAASAQNAARQPNPGGEHQCEVRAERGEHVPGGENRQRQDQDGSPQKPRGRDRHHRAACDHPGREGGDQQAGLRHADPQAGRQLRQQPGDQVLAGAHQERADGQQHHDERQPGAGRYG
jgi:hypothetical protein